METDSVSYLWRDVIMAMREKEKDQYRFQCFFVGGIADIPSSLYEPEEANEKRRRVKLKSARVYFLSEPSRQVYLTGREAQCVACVLQGDTNPKIASQLNLSARTVEFYIKNVRKKLNCQNKRGLIQLMKQTSFLDLIHSILEKI